MHAVAEEFPVYEVRRGWTSRTIVSASIVGPIIVAMAALFIITHTWLGLIAVAFFFTGLFGILDGGIRKPVALAMDERGITLTKTLARKPTLVLPWSELRAVWLMRQTRSYNTIGFATTSAPDEPRRFYPMINWALDIDRVAEILARYAPNVTIENRLPAPKKAGGEAPEMSGPPSVAP
jgi:hypothetical protein